MSNIFSKDIPDSYFDEMPTIRDAQTLRIMYKVNDMYLIRNHEETMSHIKHKMAISLGEKIIRDKMATIRKLNNTVDDMCTVYELQLDVAPPKNKNVLVQDDNLIVNDIAFNKDELVEAVKHRFPERFI